MPSTALIGVSLFTALVAILSTASAQTVVTTLINPEAAAQTGFGEIVCPIGTSLLVAATSDATTIPFGGAVHLVGPDDTIQRTFSNPSPNEGSLLGSAIAALNAETFVAAAPRGASPGSQDPGVVFLFHTDGSLLRTYTRPTENQPGANFGSALAGLGSDRVVIAAQSDARTGMNAGAAYLFSTNGQLLATFLPPNPRPDQSFGKCVAVLGNDRIVIGAPGYPGATFLFETNGTLLATMQHPQPEAGIQFGWNLATIGDNAIAVGAPGVNATRNADGAVYLFDGMGRLKTPGVTNPDPVEFGGFGLALAAVGDDRLLVTAARSSRGQDRGIAHVFTLDGQVQLTLPAPNSASSFFGFSCAVQHDSRFLIGDPLGSSTGVVFAYERPPQLRATLVSDVALRLDWTARQSNWIIQRRQLLPPSSWETMAADEVVNGASRTVFVPRIEGGQLFRLFLPQ